ncbi:hypothetical protein B0H11DRAFT_629729 [Mycena galericulata]|nr:hypothetical protein B0H11DRAFT_629729 [Mycena galericulata]
MTSSITQFPACQISVRSAVTKQCRPFKNPPAIVLIRGNRLVPLFNHNSCRNRSESGRVSVRLKACLSRPNRLSFPETCISSHRYADRPTDIYRSPDGGASYINEVNSASGQVLHRLHLFDASRPRFRVGWCYNNCNWVLPLLVPEKTRNNSDAPRGRAQIDSRCLGPHEPLPVANESPLWPQHENVLLVAPNAPVTFTQMISL